MWRHSLLCSGASELGCSFDRTSFRSLVRSFVRWSPPQWTQHPDPVSQTCRCRVAALLLYGSVPHTRNVPESEHVLETRPSPSGILGKRAARPTWSRVQRCAPSAGGSLSWGYGGAWAGRLSSTWHCTHAVPLYQRQHPLHQHGCPGGLITEGSNADVRTWFGTLRPSVGRWQGTPSRHTSNLRVHHAALGWLGGLPPYAATQTRQESMKLVGHSRRRSEHVVPWAGGGTHSDYPSLLARSCWRASS